MAVSNNAFKPRKNEDKGQTFKVKDYEQKKVVQVVVKTGEGDEDFVVKNKVLVEKIPIDQFVDSFKDEVGMTGLVNGLSNGSILPGDLPRYNPDGEVQDFTNAPENIHEAMAAVDAASDTLAQANADTGKKYTFEQFLENISKEELEKIYQEKYGEKVGNKDE
jgi:hypothetical protein